MKFAPTLVGQQPIARAVALNILVVIGLMAMLRDYDLIDLNAAVSAEVNVTANGGVVQILHRIGAVTQDNRIGAAKTVVVAHYIIAVNRGLSKVGDGIGLFDTSRLDVDVPAIE